MEADGQLKTLAATGTAAAQSAAPPKDRPAPRLQRIGELLVDMGLLTPERLTLAERAEDRDGRRFGEHLVVLGFVRNEDLLHALAVQHGLPPADLAEHVPDPAEEQSASDVPLSVTAPTGDPGSEL